MDYSNAEMERLISEYIHHDRNAEIMRLRLIKGKTAPYIVAKIAANPDFIPVCERQIHRIISREGAKLFKLMNKPPQ